MSLRLDYKNAVEFNEIKNFENDAKSALDKIKNKQGLGNDYLGWVDFPLEIDDKEIARIIDISKKIRHESDVLVIIGIGGSYLGAKAALDMLRPYFDNDFEIIFVGNTLSSTYTSEALDYIKDKDFSLNVISKSGTTTEPAIAFRLFKELLFSKYGKNANERIYVTTDPESGILRKQAKASGWESFIIPKDIGGRYSVLTAVGLLPIACGNIDIKAMLEGARKAREDLLTDDFADNPALIYASIRNKLYQDGKVIEAFVTYEPKLRYLGEWLKQLFGESEGKDNKGLFPASLVYSTDLHSMGQFVQDGSNILFETVIRIEKPEDDIIIKADKDNLDGLNYLENKTLDYVNEQALKATVLAHVDGNVPNIIINIPKINPYNFGYLVYFFMISCAVSGHILGVNPFNQEGVEAYKKNMFALLGKPGYEQLAEKLKGK